MADHCHTKDTNTARTVDPKFLGAVVPLGAALAYQKNSIVSRTLVETTGCTVTLFAFDAGQGLSEHRAPFHAMVQVLDGTAEIRIGGQPHCVAAGEALVMPADVPHAVRAQTPFKMLLIMARA